LLFYNSCAGSLDETELA